MTSKERGAFGIFTKNHAGVNLKIVRGSRKRGGRINSVPMVKKPPCHAKESGEVKGHGLSFKKGTKRAKD